MLSTARIALTILLWCYLLPFGGWWLLHLYYGDQLWWLALLSSFAPLFYLPLLFFLPLALLVPYPSYRLGLLLPLGLFLISYGALFLPKTPPSDQAALPPLTVMTFNMWSGSQHLPTAQVIADNGYPDIVALQETTMTHARLVRTVVGERYPYSYFENTLDGRGIATLSRYPLTPIRVDTLLDLNCRIFRVAYDPDRTFMLYNCRPLSSNLENFFNDGQPMAQQVRESFRVRKLLSERLVTQIQSSHEPALVIGDFNATEQSDSYQILHQALHDAHREAGWGFGHTYPADRIVWHGLPIPGRQLRIDMIWYTDDFAALTSYVSATYGESDHRPVIAQLAWRE